MKKKQKEKPLTLKEVFKDNKNKITQEDREMFERMGDDALRSLNNAEKQDNNTKIPIHALLDSLGLEDLKLKEGEDVEDFKRRLKQLYLELKEEEEKENNKNNLKI